MAATVRGIGEVGLIERIRHRVEHARAGGGVLVGIGDDAAVLRGRGGDDLLFACDMLVEGTHFHRARVTAEQIGWKALACNVSDIAAMGGEPRWAVVSVGLPRNTPVAFADGLARGLRRCADRYRSRRRRHRKLTGIRPSHRNRSDRQAPAARIANREGLLRSSPHVRVVHRQ